MRQKRPRPLTAMASDNNEEDRERSSRGVADRARRTPDEAGAVVARRTWRAPLNRALLRSGADPYLCQTIILNAITAAVLLSVGR